MTPARRPARPVYPVHTARRGHGAGVEVVFSTEDDARAYAGERSRDDRVLSASVTRYVLDELGTRRPLCWYEGGVEQPPRFDRAGLYGS